MSTQSDILDLLLDLYPPGAFPGKELPDGSSTFHADICNADAQALATAQDAADQLALEIFPQSAEECLAEWEAALKLDRQGFDDAGRRSRAWDRAKAAQPITPRNLRDMLAGFLGSQYGFWDPGTDDVLSHYNDPQAGNGSLVEAATGLIASGTTPEELDIVGDNDAHADVDLVDLADSFAVEAHLQASTINEDTAAFLYVRDRLGNILTVGHEDIGGTPRLYARRFQDSIWTELGDIAVVGPPCWFRIVRTAEGVYQCWANDDIDLLTEIVSDISLTFVPYRWGVGARNLAPWRTVSGRWQDLRIAYGASRNNVEIHEAKKANIPADYEEAIFTAFVHRDPDDSGTYELAEPRKICDRVKWGHTLITVGESDNFLTDDEYSLTDRDILGK